MSPQQPQGLDVNTQGLVTRKRSAKTTVVANDRQTIAIGGLIANEQSDSINKIPLLGDLPIIGRLFRSTKKQAKKTNLLIFLTPTVVRESNDYGAYADQYIRRFRRLEKLTPSSTVDFDEFFNLHDVLGGRSSTDDDVLATPENPARGDQPGVVDNSEFSTPISAAISTTAATTAPDLVAAPETSTTALPAVNSVPTPATAPVVETGQGEEELTPELLAPDSDSDSAPTQENLP